MKKAYKFEFTVEPKNLNKVKKLLEDNKNLFIRVFWTKVDVKTSER